MPDANGRYKLPALVLLILLSGLQVNAQKIDSIYAMLKGQLANRDDSAYIEKIGDYLTVKLTQSSDVDAVGISLPGNDYKLRPNISSITRISAAYRFLSLGLKFAPKFLPGNGDDHIKGKTRSGGFGFGLNFDHWQQDISFSKTTGYYLDHSTGELPGGGNETYTNYPSLRTTSFQGVTAYKFNRRYSLKSVITQSERQLKSAGSFMPGLMYRYYTTRDKKNDDMAQKTGNFEMVLNAGYYQTLIIRDNFYAAFGVAPGFGLINTKITTYIITGDKVTKETNPVIRIEGQGGVGYNSKRFTTGLYATVSAAASRHRNAAIINQEARFFYQFFLAYRFIAPKHLKERFDWANGEMKRAKEKARVMIIP